MVWCAGMIQLGKSYNYAYGDVAKCWWYSLSQQKMISCLKITPPVSRQLAGVFGNKNRSDLIWPKATILVPLCRYI